MYILCASFAVSSMLVKTENDLFTFHLLGSGVML
jgi:hypothetical protein